jgi:hypothetical protein
MRTTRILGFDEKVREGAVEWQGATLVSRIGKIVRSGKLMSR